MTEPTTPKEWIAHMRNDLLAAKARVRHPLRADAIPVDHDQPPPTAEQIGAEADPAVAYPDDDSAF